MVGAEQRRLSGNSWDNACTRLPPVDHDKCFEGCEYGFFSLLEGGSDVSTRRDS